MRFYLLCIDYGSIVIYYATHNNSPCTNGLNFKYITQNEKHKGELKRIDNGEINREIDW